MSAKKPAAVNRRRLWGAGAGVLGASVLLGGEHAEAAAPLDRSVSALIRLRTTRTRRALERVITDMGILDAPAYPRSLADAKFAKTLRPLRAACIGTSIYANGLRTAKDETVLTTAAGGSWSAANMDRYMQAAGTKSWFTWMCLLSGGRLLHHYNGAESSSESDSWLTRLDSQVLAKKPDLLFFGDATNDINNAYTDTKIRSNMLAIAQKAMAAGVIPVAVSTTYTTDSTKNGRIRRHNEWLMRTAWANGWHYIDPFAALVDPASTIGAPASGMTDDGLHPSYTGGKIAGQRALDQMAGLLPGPTAPALIPWVAQSRVTDLNLFANPLMQDDTNADGLADGWSVTAAAGKTLATDARVLGKLQTVTVNANGQSLTKDVSVDNTNVSVGDRLAFSGLLEVSAAAGSLQWSVGIACLGQTGTWGSRAMGYGAGGAVGVDLPLNPFYCEIVVPTGCTLVRANITTTTGTGTFSVAQLRLVNLTKAGLDGVF